jgi:hypothetical protein
MAGALAVVLLVWLRSWCRAQTPGGRDR